jgi:hypothetical protein
MRTDEERYSTHHATALPCYSDRKQDHVKIASDDVSMACDRHVRTSSNGRYTARQHWHITSSHH